MFVIKLMFLKMQFTDVYLNVLSCDQSKSILILCCSCNDYSILGKLGVKISL